MVTAQSEFLMNKRVPLNVFKNKTLNLTDPFEVSEPY